MQQGKQFLVFDAKKLNHTCTSGEFPGTQNGLSDSGWMTTGLFESWLTEHYLRHAVSSRPLLLLLDGHSTHYQPEVIRLAREKEVIMLCLPPHSTHEAQPLDVGVFGPLKAHWTNVCHECFQSNPGKVLSKFNFNSLFAKAWMKCIQPENIINGFKKCGVYPFNPKAIKTPSSICNNSLSSTSLNSIESGNSFPNIFTKEQLDLFERRWEEEYDIFDDVEYLKLYHPETLAAKGIDANNDADQETSGDMDCTSLLQITSGITVINLAVSHNNTGNEPAGSPLRMYEDDVYEDSLMQHFTSVQPLIDSEEDSSDMEVENLATGVLSSDLSGGGLSRQSTGANGGGLSHQSTGANGGGLSRQSTGANGGGLSRQSTGANGGGLSRQSTGASGGVVSRQSTGANGCVVSRQSTGASGGVVSRQSTGANGGGLSRQSTGANGCVVSRQSTGASGGVVSRQSTGEPVVVFSLISLLELMVFSLVSLLEPVVVFSLVSLQELMVFSLVSLLEPVVVFSLVSLLEPVVVFSLVSLLELMVFSLISLLEPVVVVSLISVLELMVALSLISLLELMVFSLISLLEPVVVFSLVSLLEPVVVLSLISLLELMVFCLISLLEPVVVFSLTSLLELMGQLQS